MWVKGTVSLDNSKLYLYIIVLVIPYMNLNLWKIDFIFRSQSKIIFFKKSSSFLMKGIIIESKNGIPNVKLGIYPLSVAN